MSKKEKEIIVKVQRMFPNCEKYKKCCVESGYEETMKKVKKVSNYEEMLKDIEEAFGGRK
jgi:hypothetical protein